LSSTFFHFTFSCCSLPSLLLFPSFLPSSLSFLLHLIIFLDRVYSAASLAIYQYCVSYRYLGSMITVHGCDVLQDTWCSLRVTDNNHDKLPPGHPASWPWIEIHILTKQVRHSILELHFCRYSSYLPSEVHPVSYQMGTGGSFPGVKQLRCEADHPPPSSAETKNGAPYLFMSWCLIN
jgi:hypothetical protein